jgi:hypothetical protein
MFEINCIYNIGNNLKKYKEWGYYLQKNVLTEGQGENLPKGRP